MADAAAAATMDPAPPMEVLVDRYVRFINEVAEIIEETGAPSLHQTMESVLQALPPCRSEQERENQEQRAMRKEILRYREEVQAPAHAILRERKASRGPGGVRKAPVAFTANYDPRLLYPKPVDGADFYREVLDGVEPRLLPHHHLAAAPGVASLSLRVSWPPNHPFLSYPPGAFIASCHGDLLALYVGSYRPGINSPGFYLVYDAGANSAAVAPPLPTSCVSIRSHAGVGGAGVAVVRHGDDEYVLVELLLHKDRRSHLTSNKATLFTWWSAGGSGALVAGRWIQTEVLLPFPADSPEDHHTATPPTYSFHADIVFAVASNSLCWVDLLSGILVCDGINRLAGAGAGDDDVPTFRFVPLLSRTERGMPEEYRSMCCVDGETFRFVSMDGYQDGRATGEVTLTTWTLHGPMSDNWVWEKDEASFSIRDLWDDPMYKDDMKLQPLTPSFPVISTLQHGVIYLSVTDYEYKNELLEATAFYELSLDMLHRRVTSVFKFPSAPGGGVIPRVCVFATHFSS